MCVCDVFVLFSVHPLRMLVHCGKNTGSLVSIHPSFTKTITLLPRLLMASFSDSALTLVFVCSIALFPSLPLVLQSKRVPVSIRYSADSGLKPYFLTVAKRIKETFPDVLLERVILPKMDIGESGFTSSGDTSFAGSTFEVLVDGKAVVKTAPTGGRKSSPYFAGGNSMTVFVSMDELEMAVGRARRKRRPSTVYGEDGSTDILVDNMSNIPRLEALKNKATEINSLRNAMNNKGD